MEEILRNEHKIVPEKKESRHSCRVHRLELFPHGMNIQTRKDHCDADGEALMKRHRAAGLLAINVTALTC